MGTYTGNGSSQAVNAGFTSGSRFILVKRTDAAGSWHLWDSARGIVAGNDPYVLMNNSNLEVTSDDSVDPDSSGFIVNQTATTNINVNGGTYMYLAFAGDNGQLPLQSGTTNRYASELFKFDTTGYTSPTRLDINLRAYATSFSGAGITAKIYNNSTGQFESLAALANTASSMPGSDSVASITSNVSNYIDGSKKVHLLVHSANSSVSGTSAVLNVDTVKLTVTTFSAKIGPQRLITAKPSALSVGDTWYSGVRSTRSQTVNRTETGTGILTTTTGSYLPSAPSRFATPFILGTVGSSVQKTSLFNPYNIAISNLDVNVSTGLGGVSFSTG